MHVYFYLFVNYVCFGGVMIYRFVSSFIILNIIFELVQILFPISKMNNYVKSFVLIIFLYSIVITFVG